MTDTIQINVTRDAYEAGIDRDALADALTKAAEEMGVEIDWVDEITESHPRWQELHNRAGKYL